MFTEVTKVRGCSYEGVLTTRKVSAISVMMHLTALCGYCPALQLLGSFCYPLTHYMHQTCTHYTHAAHTHTHTHTYTHILPGPPDPPGKPIVKPLTCTSVSLSWEPPASDGHSPIKLYIVECKDSVSNRCVVNVMWLELVWLTVGQVEGDHDVMETQSSLCWMICDFCMGSPQSSTHII